MSQDKISDIVNALFETEQFNNIEIAKDDGALIILLQERPSISSIELDGNQALKSEDLLKGLEGAGISAPAASSAPRYQVRQHSS